MMKQNKIETIKDFKRECNNYFYYISKLNVLLETKKGVEYRMEGVHSIDFQKSIGPHGSVNYDCRLGLMDVKNQLDDQAEEYISNIQCILDVLNRLPVPSYRAIIWKAYVQGCTMTSIAERLGISSDSLLKEVKSQVNAAIKRNLLQE